MSRALRIGLAAGTASLALALGSAARAADASSGDGADQPTRVAPVTVRGQREDTRAKLDHIMREVDGPKITVTKRSSAAILSQQGPIAGEAPRELVARLPGVLADDAAIPVRFDLGYRGFGGPAGLGYVAMLQDGLPITLDRVGNPALDYLPLPQGIAQAQMVRGGSSLIFGPAPVAAINLVSQRPKNGEPPSGSTEQVVGSNGLYSTYNAIEGANGAFLFRADLGYGQSDGQRENARSTLWQGDAWLGWRPSRDQLWYLDLHAYRVNAGDPGRLGYAQYLANPNISLTPFNHDWTSRYAATLGNELDLGEGWLLEGKLWAAYQDLSDRTALAEPLGGPPPASATLEDQLYRSEGLDLRLRRSWGRGNAFTTGVDLAQTSAPWRQWTSADLTADPSDHAGATQRLDEARRSRYAAVFAENVFRLPDRVHVVPSIRIEHEDVSVDESVAPSGLARPLIHASRDIDTPLLGLGIGDDFGHGNESYFSVTQGYRPTGFLDVASPFTHSQPQSVDPSHSLAWEAGAHGTPATGFFYDVGVYWIDLKRRVETVLVGANPDDVADLVTGDIESKGIEAELSYDFLAARASKQHLVVYGDLSLNQSRFTRIYLPGLVGSTPAYAPRTIAKAGVTWREDGRYSLGLGAVAASSMYFQDSDQASGSGASFVPARTPAHTVVDLSGDLQLTRTVKLEGGVRNLGDVKYYARAFTDGVEPAPGRVAWIGLALGF
jgi:Fe(3+) dicitrate transport protein